jgi:hypothetical protein
MDTQSLNRKAGVMFFAGVGFLIFGAILLLAFFDDAFLTNAGFLSAAIGATFASTGITLKETGRQQKGNG